MTTQLDGFYRPMKKKYGLKNFTFDPNNTSSEPCIFFGYYSNGDRMRLLRQRTGLIVIVWAGSDSMRLDKSHGALDYFKQNRHRVFHIAYSHWIQADLEAVGLEYFELPIFPVEFDPRQFKVEPLGGNIYHYTSAAASRRAFYGTDTVEQIRKSVGNTHILSNKFITTTSNAFDRKQLHEVYKKCFVGVRLTTHDNMAISCVEMSLMGRRSIFNGNIPGAIPFKDRSEVFQLILDEFEYDEPDKVVAEEMWDLINLDQKQWLDTKYYE